ncbi:TlpA family protein disulfide reductase [Candidatus Poriferisocius sp.]|uniref:TlpA family protein disulfide reductase n=1 Tax=Candidatus Poriferisocius sp. TaxID=3101276 RepID=UPI003B01615A
MARTLIALGIVAGALVVAALARRSRTAAPAAPSYSVPVHLERWDFAQPSSDWLLVVFTSKTCSTCGAVIEAARGLADDSLAVQEVEHRRHGDLHRRYGIDAVPLAVLVDRSGAVHASLAGPATPDELSNLIASARSSEGDNRDR